MRGTQTTGQAVASDVTTRALVLPWAALADIRQAARAVHPEESCGVLLGRPTTRKAVRAVALCNAHPTARRVKYALDPVDLIRVEDEAEAAGLAVIGIFHSHPATHAVPSPTDRHFALPGLHYVIRGVGADGLEQIRAWALDEDDGGFRETPIVAVEW